MAGSAGSIFVDLLLNDAKFIAGINRSKKSTKDFSDTLKTAFKGIAASAPVVGLIALTVSSLQAIDATVKLSRSLGVTIETFQALSLVADEAGVSQQELDALIGKSQKTIFDAARGNDKLAKSFALVGLSVDDLIRLTPDEQFEKMAVALSGIENPTVRTALAMELFGKQGRAVINMLEDFSSKAQEAREFNDRFNVSVSEIDARTVEEANDAFGRLGTALTGLGNTIAIKVAPLVTYLSNELLNAGVDGEEFGDFVQAGMDVAAGAIDIVTHAILGLRLAINLASITVAHFIEYMSKGLNDLGEMTSSVYNATVGKLTGTTREAEDGWKRISDAAATSGEQSRKDVEAIVQEMNKTIPTFQKIEKIQRDARDRASKGVNGKSDFLDIDLGGLKEANKEIDKWFIKQQEALLTLRQEADYIGLTTIEIEKLKDARNFEAQIAEKAYNLKGRELEAFRAQAEVIKNLRQEVLQYNYELSRTGEAGAQEFFSKYSEDATNAAENIKSVLTNAFKGAEDALVAFVKTGKLNFRELASSIIDDLIRIQIRKQLAGLVDSFTGGFGNILGGIFGAGGSTSATVPLGPSQVFGDGGYLQPGQFGIAGESGAELLYGGKTGVSVFNQDQMSGRGNTYNIDARGADQGAVNRIEGALLALAGPGVIEQRVASAQTRGAL